MANVFLAPSPILQFLNNAGQPNAGGSVLTQVGGVNYATYQDSTGNTPLPNPIPLNSRGEVSNSSGISSQLFLVAGVTYVFTLFDANNNQINQAQYVASSGILQTDYVGNLSRVVDSVAAIRSLNHLNYTRCFVTGYYAAGDGGGGNYYYDPSDTTSADNGGSIIVATDGARWKLTYIQWLSVKQFGAKGDGVTDDTVAIQNCFNAIPTGGTMYIPEASGLFYVCSKQGSNAYVFNFSRFVNIKADGFFSALNPVTGTTVNTVYLQPVVNGGYWGMKWDGLSLGSPINGTLNGLNGIFIDTQIAGSQLPGAIFTNLNIQKGSQGGVGILHINNPSNNANGGMYGCIFSDSIIQNGFSLQASGDSIHIERNIISGNGIGVYASLTSGASELTIIGNNITTNGGQIRIDSGSRFRILNNNIEQQVATTGGTTMIYIAGTNGTMANGEIRGNHMGAFTGSNMTANIYLTSNAIGTTIDGNTMLNSNAGFVGPAILDQGTQTRIGFNQYGTNITNPISPVGTGCMGAAKNLSLQNGWVTFNAGKAPYVYKDAFGMVFIVGILASGTVTANTVLFTLPDSNFYPQQLLRFAVPSNNGSAAIHGEIQIDTSGNVTIQAGGSPYLGIDVSFPAANAGQVASNL